MLSMSQRAPGYRLTSQVPPTFSALSRTSVRTPSSRSRCSMYKPENPAPMMIASNRAVPGTGLVLRRGEIATDLLNGTGQMQTRDPPFTVLLDVGFVVVTGAVQFAAVGKDDPV